MHKIKLAFRLQEDDRFVVMARAWPRGSSAASMLATETIYDHEDLFLKLVIYADLDDELTRQLVVAVILSVAEPHRSGAWIEAEISDDQNEVLGLHLPPDPPSPRTRQPAVSFISGGETEATSRCTFQENSEPAYDFLMHAPRPCAVIERPEHTDTRGTRLSTRPLDCLIWQEHYKYRP